MTKILYLFEASDWDSRMAVAHGAREKGYDIVIGLINGDDTDAARAPEFNIIPLKKSVNTMGVLSSLKMILNIKELIKQENPDIIHAVTLKYGFMTGMATIFLKTTRKIYTLAGLGYLFRSDDQKSVLLRTILRPLLTFTLRRPNTTLIFQNIDDLNLMVSGKYAHKKHCLLIRGSGVYLDRFTPQPTNHTTELPIVLMPTRLVHEKGVAIFIEAARILKARGIQANFQIAGGETQHNPKAISREEMLDMVKDGAVEWLGRVNDMPRLISQAQLIVYPSYYGEGIPRVLLESCAAGRAIVTTDHPGCREAVEDGVNGLLVPVKNAQETARAIEDLLQDHNKRNAMEIQSRKRAETQFDIHVIVAKTVDIYQHTNNTLKT
ncbi:MAG: hypothetical protein COA45_06040 [Zetaproteobacteria bacterium]|nr:MAG: hypothetical protein COA45_06040 [Zetaproteobacteria bacterium]